MWTVDRLSTRSRIAPSRTASAWSVAWLALVVALVAAPAVGAEHDGGKQRTVGRRTVTLSPRIAERLIVVNDHLEKNELDDALSLADDLLTVRRLTTADIAQIHRFRGYIYISKGQNDKAAADFEEALAQNALDASAEQGMMYSLAQIYTQLGKFDEALALIDRWFTTAEHPKPDAYYLKAMILSQQDKYEEAVEPAKAAIAMSDQPRESWMKLLIAIYWHLQDFPNLATALEQLVNLAPGTTKYWIQLAAVHQYLGHDEQALATLRLAYQAALISGDKEYRQLAQVLFLGGLPYECAKSLDAGMGTGAVKADEEAYRIVANCYIAARENDRALEPLAKAGELASDGDSFLLLGQIHLQRDRFELAREALQKALAKASPEQRGSVQLLIGVAELGSNRFDDAEAAFRAASTDERVRGAAESYLERVELQRERQAQQQANHDAAAAG